jgi:hypothetical protein
MRKLILTEDDKNYILGLYNSKVILSEGGLSKFFGGTVDDIIKNYGDDAVRTLDDVFAKIYSKASNIVSKAEGTFIVSASGAEVPITTIQSLIKLVGEGKIQANQVLNYLPRKLADGTEFRNLMQQAFEKKVIQKAAQASVISLKPNPSWIYKWFSTDKSKMIGNLFEKIKKLENIPFNPKNVKIINSDVLDSIEGGMLKQRPSLEIQVAETGDNFLIYSSTGTGAPELKQAGDWQLLAGWMPDLKDSKEIQWYLKDEATTQLTKGLNNWATELDKFIKKYGVDALGK